MSGVRATRANGRFAPAILAVLLLSSTLLAPIASAGVLLTFAQGSSVQVTAGGISPSASLIFPNPSRATSASVDVSTETTIRSVPLPAPTFARWAEVAGCPTLKEPASAFAGVALNGSELARLAISDGQNWTQPTTFFGCAYLVVEFDVGPAADPLGAPFIDVTLEVAADATAQANQSNITLALFEEPAVGKPFLRQAALAPSALTTGAFAATITHPPVLTRGPQRVLDLVLFCPDGGYNLTVDEVRATFTVTDDPKTPGITVTSTGAPIWQYRGPGGIDAVFGRSLSDLTGAASSVFPSNGATVDGTTLPLFVPARAQVRSAYLDLLPDPFSDTRANTSSANLTVGALSATSLPYAPSVEGFPIYAVPTQGTVTLYGLTAHGVVDSEQTTVSTSYVVGNITSSERAMAQTFTVSQDGKIEAIEVALDDATGHPVGPLVLELHAVSGGAPTNTTIATGSLNATAARPGGWINVTFSPPIAVTQGQVLALVMASPGATPNQVWYWKAHNGVVSDPYPLGASFISLNESGNAPWTNVTTVNVDMTFRIRMAGAFNESLAPFVTPAGASGAPVRTANYSGSLTGWTWSVPGGAIDFVPDFSGGGIWQVPVVDGLNFSVEYRWDASISFDINPRAVQLGVGNRSTFYSAADLQHRTVVDFTAELQAALAANDYIEVMGGATSYWFVPLRVHADGPANITLSAFDIAYGVTVPVVGFEGAVNAALAVAPPGPFANVSLSLQATQGSVRLSGLSVFYSSAPFLPGINPPPLTAPEGATNYTLLDLIPWFADDGGLFGLNFSVDSVVPGNITAAVFRTPVDANLTITITDGTFSGNVTIRVRATDVTGLWAARDFNVTVMPVDDPPVFAALPDAVLQGTTGTYDISGYISDEDTPPSSILLSVSSVFATLSGFVLSFDYRDAPASLTEETLTVWANDGTTNVSTPLRVEINNGGRPHLTFPGPLTVAVGHNLTIGLDDFAQDDSDPDAALRWVVVLSAGVTNTPGSAQVIAQANRTLFIQPIVPGEVDVNLSVRDGAGNLALGTLRLHVVANQNPSFGTLGGSAFEMPASRELRIPLGSYLVDGDDAFGNFTFNVAWTGAGAVAVIEGLDLVVTPLGTGGGTLNVSIIAVDSAGLTAAATFEVVTAPSGAPGGGGELLAPVLFSIGALGLIGILVLRTRNGKAKRPALSSMEKEQGEADDDDEGEAGTALRPRLPGLDKTDDERMLDDLDRMDGEAQAPKAELPPVTIFGVANAKASALLLMYRDGRAISWGMTSSPTDGDRDATQQLAAAMRQWTLDEKPGEKREWASVEKAGRRLIIEARAQLALGAVLSKGADEAIVRVNMRAALDRIFDEHAEQLKRWDGSRKGLGDVDDVLESLLRR